MDIIFDRDKAMKRTMGDLELLAELVQFTLKDMPDQLGLLKRFENEKNGFELKEAAHKLKGSAGAIGADRLFQASFKLEQLALNESWTQTGAALLGVNTAADELLSHPEIGELISQA